MSPTPSRRRLLGAALAMALGLAFAGGARAQDADAPAASSEQGGKQKKPTKEERAEALKYSVRPGTAKVFEKAREQLEAERYAEAKAALDELRLDRLTPHERAQAHRLHGYIAYGSEQHADAIEQLRKALDEEDGLPPRERADVLFQVAQIQAVLERWSDLVATLTSWFQIVEQPNSSGYFLLALAHFQLGDLDAALPPAQQAVEIAKMPQQSWLQLLLAILLTKEDYAGAKLVLDQMIALYPNSGKNYWLQLAALHGVTGDEARALGVLEVAYRKGLLKDDDDLRRLLQMMIARGVPYRAAHILEKEMTDARFKEDAEALELLSISWILARESERALAPLARAAEISETGDLYLHLAQIHLLEEKWQEAVAVLRKAVAKGGLAEPGTAQLMLGIAYYNERELEEARDWFTRAQQSAATRQQAELWLQHVERAMSEGNGTGRASLGTGG